MLTPVAHVKKSENGQWAPPHDLFVHLFMAALLGEQFAPKMLSGWITLALRWHDLGKYREKFQHYIRLVSGYEAQSITAGNQPTKAPHSTAGALHALKVLGPGYGHLLAYVIAGHHAGLADWFGDKSSLSARLSASTAEYEETLCGQIPDEILSATDVVRSNPLFSSTYSAALWIRMLFSCLVDADYLDTERYMSPEKFALRGNAPSLAQLYQRYRAYMKALAQNAADTPLQRIRRDVLDQTISAAGNAPGMYSLTVPTGGGKTLASLGFALEHALRHNKKRIIYAIPFTSIIEQNASVFRDVLGDEAVLEHHCNAEDASAVVKGEYPDDDRDSVRKLATENWDAPLIVTTNVQLFESLHASRPGRCRKLHNLVDSVIILDEAQQLPRDFHLPIVRVMNQLSDMFGVTWLLCTATQPVLEVASDATDRGDVDKLCNVREIIPEPAQLSSLLKRVNITFSRESQSWEAVADRLAAQECVLCIVNTRRHARELFALLPDDGNTLHLSAGMCATHRSRVINEIRQRLAARRTGDTRPLRVVSTQLVEAGVDVDFPCVFRAMAGLDAIAQAAGRCNREGKMADVGQVWVFQPPENAPSGFLLQAEQCTKDMLDDGLLDDPLSPQTIKRFFTRLNKYGKRDKHNICQSLTAESSADTPLAIAFRTAAENFRLIDDKGVAVVVPYCPPESQESPVEMLVKTLESDPGAKWVYRKLQRYCVTLPESVAIKLHAKGGLEERAGLFVVVMSHYNACWGVDISDELKSYVF